MEKSKAEIFNEKVSLIYEYNRSTPLFVRMANIELEKNNIERAIDILNNGLKIYPYYAAAHFLLGKAFTRLGSFGHAVKAIKAGSELSNSKKSFDYYFREIENLKKQRSMFEVTQRTSFFTHELDNFEEQEQLPAAETGNSVDDNLDRIADDMKNAKINLSNSSSFNEIKSFENMDHQVLIASETLAKIYLAQGEYKEAIATYQRLIQKTPAKEEYYLQKIEEINKQSEL